MYYKRVRDYALRLKFTAGQVIDRFPPAYRFWRYLLWRFNVLSNEYLVNDQTSVVIEGFPRSANSFAYVAFLTSQPQAVAIAHHTHRPSQVIAGIRRKLPTLVLIRQPEDAVLSLIILHPFVSVSLGLKSYIEFYSRLEPYRKSFVLATFDEVITDFASVMTRINENYGTCFSVFAHTEENVQMCFKLIEQWGVMTHGHHSERTVARPSDARERQKIALASEIERDDVRVLLEGAREIYARYRQTVSPSNGRT